MHKDPKKRRHQLNLRLDDETWLRLLDMQRRLGCKQIGVFARPMFEERVRQAHQLMPAYDDGLDRSRLYEEPRLRERQTQLPIGEEVA